MCVLGPVGMLCVVTSSLTARAQDAPAGVTPARDAPPVVAAEGTSSTDEAAAPPDAAPPGVEPDGSGAAAPIADVEPPSRAAPSPAPLAPTTAPSARSARAAATSASPSPSTVVAPSRGIDSGIVVGVLVGVILAAGLGITIAVLASEGEHVAPATPGTLGVVMALEGRF